MKSTLLITCLSLLLTLPNVFASEINKISLSELQKSSDLIVLAKVTTIVKKGNTDKVTIKVGSFLKGREKQTVFTFTLVCRGGLKDFDPTLQEGRSGVFFLKYKKQKGSVEKAYWGSVATFTKDPFTLSPN